MNIEAMRKAVKYLEEEPKRLLMNASIIEQVTPDSAFGKGLGADRPDCGTVCCFAGAVVITHYPNLETVRREFLGSATLAYEWIWHNVQDLALQALDIPPYEGEQLFYLQEWPLDYWGRFREAENAQQRVSILREYLEFKYPELKEAVQS